MIEQTTPYLCELIVVSIEVIDYNYMKCSGKFYRKKRDFLMNRLYKVYIKSMNYLKILLISSCI